MVTTARVLLVDDLPENLEVLQALLAKPDVELATAESGEQALEMLLEQEFAVAVLDVQMPGMDGFELAELMRGTQRTRHVPIIFVTAGTHDLRRIFKGYQAGAVDFLHKPLDPPVLRSKVDVFIELYRQRRLLATQLEELTAALRLNETFTAVLGHDLRTPLSAVVNAAEVLLRSSSDPIASLAGTRIRQSADRMARMIEQLLDLAMLRSGKLALQSEPADLLPVCASLADELEPVGIDIDPARRRIRVEARGNTRGTFDVDRIGEVVSNLLGNAIQHGRPAAPVMLLVDGTEPETLVIRIHNQGSMRVAPSSLSGATALPRGGSGPAPVHERDAPPPSSPVSVTSVTSGTSVASIPSVTSGGERRLGLGLQIAEQFVLAHRGRIECRSNDEDGTTFEVKLPRQALS
jgi:two-component system, sensor histidine kinase and response regulator